MNVHEIYDKWLRDFADDADTVADLKAIADDEKEIEDRFYTDLSFGTGGMRGVLGAGTNRMNKYNVRRATKGLAQVLKNAGQADRGVVIAYDSRRFSSEFAQDAALVLCQEGVKAMLFDALRPVPVLSFAVRHLKAAAGIVITASHNPKQYNGYKVYGENGAQVSPAACESIIEAIHSFEYTDCKLMDRQQALDCGMLQIIGDKEVDDAYIEQVKSLCVNPELMAREGKNLSIVYTPIHGSGNVPVRRILNAVGITNVSVVKEQEMPDPEFSTVPVPNPEDSAALSMAIDLARQINADAVFGTDPDCDRLGVAVRDRKGNFQTLNGNQIGCIILHYLLSTKKKLGTLPENGAVCKSIVTTSLVNDIAKSFGVEVFETLTGFKYIGDLIHQFGKTGSHTFLFGLEESHGYLSSTFVRDKDGVNASLLIAEAAAACKAEGMTLYEYMMSIYQEYGSYANRTVSRRLPGKDGKTRMAEIMKGLREHTPAEVGGLKVVAVRDYLTGIRTENGVETPTGLPTSNVLYFELDGGNWVCVRPSGTEPKIKLYVVAKAPTKREANERLDELCAAAEHLLD